MILLGKSDTWQQGGGDKAKEVEEGKSLIGRKMKSEEAAALLRAAEERTWQVEISQV